MSPPPFGYGHGHAQAPGFGFPGYGPPAGGGGATNIVGFGFPMPTYGGAPPYAQPPPPPPPQMYQNPYGYTPLNGYAPPPPSPAYHARQNRYHRKPRRPDPRAAYMTGARGSSLSSGYTPSSEPPSPFMYYRRSRTAAPYARSPAQPKTGARAMPTFAGMQRAAAPSPHLGAFVNLAARRRAPMPPRINTTMLAARQQVVPRSGVQTGRYSARSSATSARPFLGPRTPRTATTPVRRSYR